ncbi:MAG: hypothetical protein ACOX7N_05655 [Lawsonibacter sp.]
MSCVRLTRTKWGAFHFTREGQQYCDITAIGTKAGDLVRYSREKGVLVPAIAV